MPKLIIMRGLPASGKTTKAREIVKASGNTVIVNRDSLRKMLHNNKWSSQNEKYTIGAQEALATFFLCNGKNVIIDDTNLNPKVFDKWKKYCSDIPCNVIDLTKVDMYECIQRDMVRKNSVGFWTIINMARQHGYYPRTRKDIICDIDGTLCDISNRLHLIKGTEQKDWDAFFANIPNDLPRWEIIQKVKHFSKDFNIVLVTGRPDNYRRQTMEWLAKHRVPYETILMRKAGDHRPDDIVKEEILNTYLELENIELVIDDRPRVIKMWDKFELKIEDVGNGVDF